MLEGYSSWIELEDKCPIDIKTIIKYSEAFESYLPETINLSNIEEVKENLFSARSCFDSMITSLIQMLYNREILKTDEDKILYTWLIDNLGRFLRFLDDREEFFLIKYDTAEKEGNMVGISRLSAYAKLLKTSADSVIYNSITKATEEYNNLKVKEPRAFLYILFQILQVTLSVIGGLTREKAVSSKKGLLQTLPINWQTLMSPQGKEFLKQGFKEDTGIDISNIESDLQSLGEDVIVEGEIEDEN